VVLTVELVLLEVERLDVEGAEKGVAVSTELLLVASGVRPLVVVNSGVGVFSP